MSILMQAIGGILLAAALTSPQEEQATREEPVPLAMVGGDADADDLRRQLAEIGAQVRVDGNLESALLAYHLVWMQASSQESFEGQTMVLIEVALVRSKLLADLGRHEEAIRALDQLLPVRGDPLWNDNVLMQIAPQPLRQAVAEVHDNWRLIEARAELAKAQQPGAREADEERSLRETIVTAAGQDDWNLILGIGSRAQPYLAEMILERPDYFPTVENDPLVWLIRLEQPGAAKLLLENLHAGGKLWESRILRAMTDMSVLDDRATWTGGREGPICLQPEWLRILETLLRSPGTAGDCMDLVHPVLARDALTPAMQEALASWLVGEDSSLAYRVAQLLDNASGAESAKPILEHAARHGNPEMRRIAAGLLQYYTESEALLELADDPDPDIRARVAGTLRPTRSAYVRGRTVKLSRTMGEREWDLLARLLADEAPEVRSSAAYCLQKLDTPLADEVYRRLARDESAEVRAVLAWQADKLDPRLGGEILATLAAERQHSVLEGVDGALEEAVKIPDPSPYLSALLTRMAPSEFPMPWDDQVRLLSTLVKTDAGVAVAARLVLELENDEFLRQFYSKVSQEPDYDYAQVLRLPDELLADLLHRTFVVSPQGSFRYPRSRIESADRPPQAAMRLLLTDPEASVELRLWAAKIVAPEGGSEFREGLIRLLTNPWWKENPPTEDDIETLAWVGRSIPLDERNAFLLEVLARRDILDALCTPLAKCHDAEQPLGREVTLAILERLFQEGGGWNEAVNEALESSRLFPDDIEPALLAAAVRNRSYAEKAVETMAARPDPRFMEILGDCLDAHWLLSESAKRATQCKAAQALTGYFNDEAAAYLVRGLSSPCKYLRNDCRVGLDQIEEYQRRMRAWEQRGAPRMTKENALAELVGMLEDEDPLLRGEAARGLATLGATEYLPRLIRMLKDEDESVRTSVRKALDVLHERGVVETETPEEAPAEAESETDETDETGE